MYSLRNVFDLVRLVIQLYVIQGLFHRGYLIWFPSGSKSHSTRSKYYAKNLANTYNGEHYAQLIRSLLNKKSVSTSTDIKFLGDIKNQEISIWKLICKYGNPGRCISLPDTGNNKILVYKQELGCYRVKSEFHFYKNRMFYVSYTFPYVEAKDFLEIIKVILEKYHIADHEATNMYHNYIIDSKENVISFGNDMTFSLNYFNPASAFFLWLSQQRDNKVTETITKGEQQKDALRAML